MRRSLVGVLCAGATLCCAIGADGIQSAGATRARPPRPPRLVVPIEQTAERNGAIRYWIPMRIDGRLLPVMLDTGSTGLRLMPAAVAMLHLAPGRTPTTYAFSSGVVLRGSLVKVEVGIATATPTTVLAQAVSAVSCDVPEYISECPSATTPPERIRIGPPHSQGQGGFTAILGVGLYPGDVPNPLTALSNGRWIIDLPLPVDRRPGRLIVSPPLREFATYRAFALQSASIDTPSGRTRGWHDTLPGCLRIEGDGRPFCRQMALDTGGSGFTVATDRIFWARYWPQGSKVTLTFDPHHSARPMGFQFTSGRSAATAVRLLPTFGGPVASTQTLLNNPYPTAPVRCGAMPFFYFSVAYDTVKGLMWLEVRRRFQQGMHARP